MSDDWIALESHGGIVLFDEDSLVIERVTTNSHELVALADDYTTRANKHDVQPVRISEPWGTETKTHIIGTAPERFGWFFHSTTVDIDDYLRKRNYES